MKTLLLPADKPGSVELAGSLLAGGGLVALPTETVYGLAANAYSSEAVKKIFEAKGRPQDNPLIVHIAEPGGIYQICREVPDKALALAEAFWPGPLTMVLKKREPVPREVTCGLDTVAVRLPAHDTMRAVIRSAGVPLAAPSANLSGRPSPTCAGHVWDDLAGRIDAIVDGGACEVGLESTVVDLSGEVPALLRPGGIAPEQIRDVIGFLAVESEVSESEPVRAPGMKYRHYAPRAPLCILRGKAADAAEYAKSRDGKVAVMCFDEDARLFEPLTVVTYGGGENAREQSERLFGALRRLDELNADQLYAQATISREGRFLAVINRLEKAANYQIIDV